MKYILEPMVFALDENASEHDFKVYVNRLILWDRWMDRHPEDVYILSDTSDLLYLRNFFPVYSVFDTLMKKYKIDYVQSSNLNQMINRLIQRARKIDKDGLKKVDGDVSFESLDIEGEVGEIDDSVKRLLWAVYCRCQNEKDSIDTYVVFGRNLTDNLKITVRYQTYEEKDDDLVEVPVEDNATIVCRNSLADFFKDKNTPNAILNHTDDKDDLSLALRVAVYQMGGLKKVIDTYEKFDFVIQDSFFQDYCDAHYQSNTTIKNRLMEEMSHVLLNIHLDNRHEWRTNEGGASPQERHGDYLAWRWFVTRSVKMMYWQNACRYKFANVKEHDIFVCQWEG